MSTPTTPPPAAASTATVKELADAYLIDEQLLRAGGGKSAIERQHEKGRLTARERIELLLDAHDGTPADQLKGRLPRGGADRFQELALFSAWGMYKEFGGAPSAGVVTGIGTVSGRRCMIIANDATVKAGAFFPMTCKKIIRAQEIAMRARLPLIYLVDSAGVFLPMQEDVFPDTDDFGRIFRHNAVISAMGIPQIAAIMGYCVAGGGYLPVLCDTLLMTEGSGLYLAGPALVKAAIGQEVTDEDLGGATMHASISGTIDFKEKDDAACIKRVRSLMAKYAPEDEKRHALVLQRMLTYLCPRSEANDWEELYMNATRRRLASKDAPESVKQQLANMTIDEWITDHMFPNPGTIAAEAEIRDVGAARKLFEQFAVQSTSHASAPGPVRDASDVYTVFTDKPGTQYDVRDLIACFVDADASKPDFDEYKADYGQSLVCGYAKVSGLACGILANQKKITKTGKGMVQMGGVIYDDSADKAARFIMDCNQRKIPIIFMHDTTGFMVGRESEQGGIIRAGAKMVNAMANCVVPKIVLITGASYGAGNYAMCGRAFDPFISLAWPNAKCAVMGANQATGVLTTIEEASRKRKGETIDEATHKQIYGAIHASYTSQADIRYAAARGWVDRIIQPHETRAELIAALEAAANWDYSPSFKTGVLQT